MADYREVRRTSRYNTIIPPQLNNTPNLVAQHTKFTPSINDSILASLEELTHIGSFFARAPSNNPLILPSELSLLHITAVLANHEQLSERSQSRARRLERLKELFAMRYNKLWRPAMAKKFAKVASSIHLDKSQQKTRRDQKPWIKRSQSRSFKQLISDAGYKRKNKKDISDLSTATSPIKHTSNNSFNVEHFLNKGNGEKLSPKKFVKSAHIQHRAKDLRKSTRKIDRRIKLRND